MGKDKALLPVPFSRKMETLNSYPSSFFFTPNVEPSHYAKVARLFLDNGFRVGQ